MKKIAAAFYFLVIAFSVYSQTGTIQVTSVSQRSNGSGFVDIYFNLNGPGSTYNISVEVSFNGGSSYSTIPANYLSGHVNGISPGNNKQIVWDGLGSFPNNFNTQTKLKITANEAGGGSGTGQPCPGTPTITDIDGNVYNTVLIGNQCWMKENLNTTRDAAGNNIYHYCYDNNTTYCDLYGRLYLWQTLMNGAGSSNNNPSGVQGICPTGWHVPSDAEWSQLVDYVAAQGYPNSNVANGTGNALKSCRQENSPLAGDCNTTVHPRWDSDITHNGFDEFGFSALPGGGNAFGYYGNNVGKEGNWWSSTEYSSAFAWVRVLRRWRGDVYSYSEFKTAGFSVRCLKDSSPPQGTINTINCSSATNNGTLTQGTPASSVSSTVPYTGGNGGIHNGQTVTSTGVTGLTATLAAGSFANGDGTITYTITGTPSSSGTASFALNIGGQSCTLTRNVNTSGGTWPPGTVHCSGTPTAIVDVTNPVTGKTWMDRNLGASQAATSSVDPLAYGDLYQWGRFSDGHQCRNSGTTATLSSSDTPGHGNFILAPVSPNDWHNPQNNNLWQDVSGINNPCPLGYRLPTEADWEAERQSWSSNNAAGAFNSLLKLPVAGFRSHYNGSFNWVGPFGYYFSSTVSGIYSRTLIIDNNASIVIDARANGNSVRCIKD
jgi:uncharacterized protein (TIGR02145 family)